MVVEQKSLVMVVVGEKSFVMVVVMAAVVKPFVVLSRGVESFVRVHARDSSTRPVTQQLQAHTRVAFWHPRESLFVSLFVWKEL